MHLPIIAGTMGEDPAGIPNCLMPYVLQVLVGRLPQLTVHGSDYPTRDGTCIRDYIHVVDVARGHLDALNWMDKEQAAKQEANGGKATGLIDVFNFGTGNGTTVLELVSAMEKACGQKVNMAIGPRREGDLDAAYADPSKVRPTRRSRQSGVLCILPLFRFAAYLPADCPAFVVRLQAARVLGWKAQYSIDKICEDAWRWQSNNPQGYSTKKE